MRELHAQKQLKYTCHECQQQVSNNDAIFCDSCQEWSHFKCEGLTNRPPISEKFFCKRCYKEAEKAAQ